MIIDKVKGFNPAKWTLQTAEKTILLSSKEIAKAIKLHDRLEIPSEQIDSITSMSTITITGASCGFNPNKWTVSFND